MRTLGDRIGGYPQLGGQRARERADMAVREVIDRMEVIEQRQHARERAEERDAIERGWLDLGGEGA